MARDRRPSRASPDRHVEFTENLISGPSRRGNPQPTLASNSAVDTDIEMTDISMADQQLQDDFSRITADSGPQKDDSPEEDSEFWESLPPSAPIGEGSIAFDELNEAQKDHRVCKGMNFLVAEIVDYAKKYSGEIRKNGQSSFVKRLLSEENKELIRYIGRIAQGGRDGIAGWTTLLTGATSRQALVVGIIGRALEEHVFSALYFGADRALADRLDKMEKAQVDDEGFSRTQARASAIINSEQNPTVAKLHEQVGKITAELSAMLEPFCEAKKSLPHLCLYKVVYHAGQLSRMMRRASDVVYYWPPIFKDEEFEPGRMEAMNLAGMIHGSPYDRETINGRERAILKPGREDESEAIVRVVCFPGLVAYRQGGGDLAKIEIAAEKKRGITVPEDVQAHRRRGGEQPLSADQGICSKTVWKSLVLLQWGQQRLLTKEAGTSSHIDAVRDGKMDKYDQDYKGFVELYSYAEKEWNS